MTQPSSEPSDEAVEAAGRAVCHIGWNVPAEQAVHVDSIRAALAAAMPIWERDLRSQLAEDIVTLLQARSKGLRPPSAEMYDLGLLDARRVVQGLCPTVCDDDCDEPCHEGHLPRWKQDHDLRRCPAVRGSEEDTTRGPAV